MPEYTNKAMESQVQAHLAAQAKTSSKPSESNMVEIQEPDIKQVYRTTYKKSQIIGHFHFMHSGGLSAAVSAVKGYLQRHHLKHIHTTPFIINLNSEYSIDEQENPNLLFTNPDHMPEPEIDSARERQFAKPSA